MNSKQIVAVFAIILSFLSAAHCVALAASGNSAAAVAKKVFVDAKPLFSVAVGKDSPEKIGFAMSTESSNDDYDVYTMPAAFQSYESLGFIIVLDSINNRLCKYSNAGKFIGAVEIPFKFQAIDFSWFPGSKRAFIAFQDVPRIGAFDVDFASGDVKISSSKLLDLGTAEDSETKDFYAQNIWPCDIANASENIIVANLSSSPGADYAAYSLKDGKFAKIKDIDGAFNNLSASINSTTAVGVYSDTMEAKIVMRDLKTAKTNEFVLPEEFFQKAEGMSCHTLKAAGCDSKGNIYVEALYGAGENTTGSEIVKFGSDGKIAGRRAIFSSPEMLTNRYISVDATGSVYYMKYDEAKREIGFYRFESDK